MSRLLELLTRDRMTLIVSLPRNDQRLAEAALDGGAEVLKVHVHVSHAASNTRFGSLDEELEPLRSIAALCQRRGVPVGVVAGAEKTASPAEMQRLADMGMDYFDLYASHMPAWMLDVESMTRVVAIDENWTRRQLRALKKLRAEAVEAACVAHAGYGLRLTAADLVDYFNIARATSLPVIVPTQRAITPADVPALRRSGVKALMIGAIVTGKDAESMEAATRAFRMAVEG